MPVGLRPKSDLSSLFILCFSPYFFQDYSPPRLALSHPNSPDSLSSTIASQYIKLDGLITPSPSTGQLTEHKQWQAHLGICGTQSPGGKLRGNQLFYFLVKDFEISWVCVCVSVRVCGLLYRHEHTVRTWIAGYMSPINTNAWSCCVWKICMCCLSDLEDDPRQAGEYIF